jgi:hypothetical protein
MSFIPKTCEIHLKTLSCALKDDWLRFNEIPCASAVHRAMNTLKVIVTGCTSLVAATKPEAPLEAGAT